MATGQVVLDLAERGVRTALVRFAPTVHGAGDHGFVATLVELARRSGVAGYVGDGSNRWPAVHRLDAPRSSGSRSNRRLPVRCCTRSPRRALPTRDIAEAIGRSLGVPARSVPAADAAQHFGWIGAFFGMDAVRRRTRLTRELTGWTPTHPGLIDDLDAGGYVDAAPHSAA